MADRETSSRGRRRRIARLVVATALFALFTWLVGCTSTVRPPAGPLTDPVEVFASFDDRHRGLVLPRGGEAWVEYGFGEFAWYAEMRDQWYRVFPAMLWPTRGTLGRRQFAAADAADIRRRFHWVRFESVLVERARADALVARLDARFERGRAERIDNRVYRMEFVPDDDGYWCCFNCNDSVACWLRELDCSVTWVPIRLDLAVVPAAN